MSLFGQFTASARGREAWRSHRVSARSRARAMSRILIPSTIAESVFAPLPRTKRGVALVLHGDPKGKNFLYTVGHSVIIRDIEVSGREEGLDTILVLCHN